MPSKAIDLCKQYVEACSAISDQQHRSILQHILEADITCRIPRMERTAHSILIEDMNEFQAKFPGGKFTLHSVSEHHDVALMQWQLMLLDGTPSMLGHDVIRITSGGKLGQIITFAPSTLEP